MTQVRPSTQIQQDGANDGETWVWDTTTGRYVHGAPAPAAHTHVEADVTSLVADLAGKSAVGHSHAESDVTSLVTDLAGKAPSLTLGTRLGTTSLDTDGNPVLSYTTVYGIGSDGVPYYDPAGPVSGEEAVLYVGTDGGVYVVAVTG